MKTKLTLIAVVASLCGCATAPMGTQYRPIVDQPCPNYESDLADCQAHSQKSISAANAAAGAAVATALLGAFLAPKGFRNEVAGRAGVVGGLAGAGQATQTQEQIIKTCLMGRGHRVLH